MISYQLGSLLEPQDTSYTINSLFEHIIRKSRIKFERLLEQTMMVPAAAVARAVAYSPEAK